MTLYCVQQDKSGKWWRVPMRAWQQHQLYNVVLMGEKEPCVVNMGIIAMMDLAGEDVRVGDFGYLYVPLNFRVGKPTAPVYVIASKYCPLEIEE